jgi:hypothetical protein
MRWVVQKEGEDEKVEQKPLVEMRLVVQKEVEGR